MNARTFNPDGCYVFPRAGKSVALPPIYYDFDTTDSGREAQNWPIKHFFRCWPGRDSGAGRPQRVNTSAVPCKAAFFQEFAENVAMCLFC